MLVKVDLVLSDMPIFILGMVTMFILAIIPQRDMGIILLAGQLLKVQPLQLMGRVMRLDRYMEVVINTTPFGRRRQPQ